MEDRPDRPPDDYSTLIVRHLQCTRADCALLHGALMWHMMRRIAQRAILHRLKVLQPAFAFPRLVLGTYSATMRPANHEGYRDVLATRCHFYDLIIVENALYCLTYPLVQLHQLHGVRVAYWGHGRDIRSSVQPGWLKQQMERLAMALVRRADGFLRIRTPFATIWCNTMCRAQRFCAQQYN